MSTQPIITYRVDTEDGAVWLEVDAVGPTTIWRTSTGSGRSVAVRGAYKATDADARLELYDYEVPIGVEIIYTAVWGDTTTGPDNGDVIGVPTDPITLTTTDSWLVDLWDASWSLKVWVEDFTQANYGIEQDIAYPLMRRTPVVSGNVRRAQNGTLTIITETDLDAAKVRNLVANGVPILFQAPMEYGVGNLYMTVGAVSESRMTRRGAEQLRRFVLDYAEVERPRPEWVVNLDTMTNINFADALLIWGVYDRMNTSTDSFEAVRTTKKGGIGDNVAFPIRPPDLTDRGE